MTVEGVAFYLMKTLTKQKLFTPKVEASIEIFNR